MSLGRAGVTVAGADVEVVEVEHVGARPEVQLTHGREVADRGTVALRQQHESRRAGRAGVPPSDVHTRMDGGRIPGPISAVGIGADVDAARRAYNQPRRLNVR
jgi:hypothetical protein